jgi:hypothetical protein
MLYAAACHGGRHFRVIETKCNSAIDRLQSRWDDKDDAMLNPMHDDWQLLPP